MAAIFVRAFPDASPLILDRQLEMTLAIGPTPTRSQVRIAQVVHVA